MMELKWMTGNPTLVLVVHWYYLSGSGIPLNLLTAQVQLSVAEQISQLSQSDGKPRFSGNTEKMFLNPIKNQLQLLSVRVLTHFVRRAHNAGIVRFSLSHSHSHYLRGLQLLNSENRVFCQSCNLGGSFHNLLDVICTKYLPGLEQLLLGHF